MPDPLQRLVLSRSLWLMVAPPMLGLFWHLAAHLRERRAGKARMEWTRRVGFGSVLLASAATLGHVLTLARAPAEARALVQHVGSSVRTGPVVAGFDLLLDPLSGAASTLACAVAIAGGTFLASRASGSRSLEGVGMARTRPRRLLAFLPVGRIRHDAPGLGARCGSGGLAGWLVGIGRPARCVRPVVPSGARRCSLARRCCFERSTRRPPPTRLRSNRSST